MKIIAILLFIMISTLTSGQEIDTLSFFSNAFNEQRSVYIHKPEFYKYKSESVQLPVIYILDGQHEWFINPLLSAIHYLQYTHEIPNALVVVIPHKNRNKECGIVDLETELPLDTFITEELDKELKKYNPGDFKLIIGHSFSASFSLYSYYNHPDYYTAVIANTPLDEMDLLVNGFLENKKITEDRISISIGGIAQDKDYYHRKNYNLLKEKYPDFFNSINVFEANYSAHNAVPIVSTPMLLTKIFEKFSSRYSEIAKVNDEYKLIMKPVSVKAELAKIEVASKIGDYFYPPEIADLNGIASRFLNSDLNDYGIAVYELALKYFPNYYDFHLELYKLLLPTNIELAKAHLNKAYELLTNMEIDLPEKQEVLDEIYNERQKNGWQ